MILKGLQWLIWRDPEHREALLSPLQSQGGLDHNVCILKGSGTYGSCPTHARQTAQVCVYEQWPGTTFARLSVCVCVCTEHGCNPALGLCTIARACRMEAPSV